MDRVAEPEFVVAPDLFVDNPAFVILRRMELLRIELAGCAWLYEWLPPRVAHLQALQLASDAIQARLPDYRLWLLASHSATQRDNRVVRYYKLWKGLKLRGHELPLGQAGTEYVVRSPDGIRFFGALRLDQTSEALKRSLAIAHEERASHLVAIPAGRDDISEQIAAGGWSASEQPASEILASVVSRKGVVFVPLGDFDDRIAGIGLATQPCVVERLAGKP